MHSMHLVDFMILIESFFQAHRLVLTTCTNYFLQLEHQQKVEDDNFDGIIVMPSDMPYECVKSIIRYIYIPALITEKIIQYYR